jgi:hypothetical protein
MTLRARTLVDERGDSLQLNVTGEGLRRIESLPIAKDFLLSLVVADISA